MSDLPFISVVIPVRNEANHIEAVLSSLANQDYPKEKVEIIICDGRSDDDTVAIAERFGASSPIAQRVLPNPGIRSSSGRNVGIRAARGEIVCFVDGHCRIANEAMLGAIARLMSDPEVDCIARPQRLYADSEEIFQFAVVLARASRLGHAADSTIYEDQCVERVCDPASSGAIYRMSVFQKVGMYDESFDACEDVELNVRVRQAGMKAVLSSAVEIFYVGRRAPAALLKQMTRYGAGRIRLMRKHASERRLKALVTVGILLFLTVAPIASLILPASAALAWWSFILIYLLALVFTGLVAVAKENQLSFGKRSKLAAAVAFALLLIHLGLGYGEFREFVRFKRDSRL